MNEEKLKFGIDITKNDISKEVTTIYRTGTCMALTEVLL